MTPVHADSREPRARSRPLRILHVTRRFHPMPGGIERYVLTVARGQAQAGHDVTVYTLDRDVLHVHHGPLMARETVDGVRVVRVPGAGAQRYAIAARPDILARLIAANDVVHLHDLRFMTATVAGISAILRKPLVFHTHGLLYHTSFATRLKRILMRAWYGPWLRVAKAWTAASSLPDLAMLLADVPALATRAATFENALDLTRLLRVARAIEPGLVVVTGRVAPRKGIGDLLAALARLPRSTAWHVEIAGSEEPEERRRLEAEVVRLGLRGRVRFCGEYTDEEHLERLGRAAVAAFPSRAEGFGLALLEALAVGVPVVARDQAGHRDVAGDELADRLVDFDDAAAAAAALRTALELTPDEASRLGERERSRAAVFALPRLLDEIEQLYDRALEGG